MAIWVAAFAIISMLSSFGLSRLLEEDNAALARALNPFNAEARVASITDSLNRSDPPPDLEQVESDVLDALRLDPVDARLHSLLAEVHYRQGDKEAAYGGFEQALALSKTEVHALQRTILRFIEEGEIGRAIAKVDLLLRRWPSKIEALAAVLPALMADETGYSEIFARLASDAPWRGGLFRVLSNNPASLSSASRLLQDLVRSDNPPRASELTSVTSALIREKQYGSAYRLFLMTLSAEEKQIGGYVHNSNFSVKPSGRPFGWQMREQPGHTISIAPKESGGQQRSGLVIQFNGTPVKNISVQQYLQLPPGEYVLLADVTTLNAKLPKGLFWSLRCTDPSKEIAKLDIPEGSFDSRALQVGFQVNGLNCPLQILRLNTSAIAESWKNRYTGRVFIHNIRIEKVVS